MIEGWRSCGDPERIFELPPSAVANLIAAMSRAPHDAVLADPKAPPADRLRARIALGET